VNQKVNLSVAIITYNEESNIKACLEAVRQIADEIVVIDSFSTDKTEEICSQYDTRFLQHHFTGHIEQKNYAMEQARFDHILSVDADEVVSEKLKEAILATKTDWGFEGYTLNRLTNYCGKWIRHCGWYPDTKLRLWDRSKGSWGGVNPHDRIEMVQGSRIGHLKGDLLHYSYRSISQHISQINSFSSIAAHEADQKGYQLNVFRDIICNPPFTFLKKFLLQLGILDGYYGFVISKSSALSRFLKYIKLYEIQKK
jgi:glycosyltransferase involved in cell wall biosynthesis